jgi:hypothetical protein
MRLQNMAILCASLALGVTPALADGFSATIDLPVSPVFSLGAGLHYSTEIIPNLFVGGSLNLGFTPSLPAASQFGVSARVAAKYIIQVLSADNTFVNIYAGAGFEAALLPASSVSTDLNAGFVARYGISQLLKVYGGMDGTLAYNFSVGQFNPQISGYAGLKFEPLAGISLYTQAALGFNGIATVDSFGSGLLFDTRVGLYYDLIPQFRLGFYAGYNGGFVFGIGGQYSLKPGTLAIPGNYLP